jgi:uncharacterized membrane protein
MRNTAVRWAILILLCIIAVPAMVFFGGMALVGPYAGEGGFMGLLGHIYGDALGGSATAWFLLLAPLLVALIWVACLWVQRNMTGTGPAAD